MLLRAILLLVTAFCFSGVGYAAEPTNFGPYGYYELRPDYRKCIAPLCGGFWLKRVNHPKTMCADHKARRECYVATLEHAPESLWGGDEPIVVRGWIRPREYEGFGNLGYLDLRGAWRAASAGHGSGQYVGIENSGIVCVTTPCESWDLYLLNKPINRPLTGFDLRAAVAPAEREEQALELLGGGDVLLLRGFTNQLPGNPGYEFEATQFYLPIK